MDHPEWQKCHLMGSEGYWVPVYVSVQGHLRVLLEISRISQCPYVELEGRKIRSLIF